MKIGLLGGTFNPIHVGHLLLAEWAADAFNLDKVVLMPTGISYLKLNVNVLSGEERLHMTRLAIEGNDRLIALDTEVKREGYTYTYETLEELHRIYPDSEIYFICGADCLFAIESWKCPERIFDNCIMTVAVRGDADINEMEQKKQQLIDKYHASVEMLPFMRFSVSSSEIRARIQTGKSVKYLLPESVYTYIKEKNLYRE